MSRIGKKPVILPNNVNVEVKDNVLFVKGPKGTLEQPFSSKVSFSLKDKEVQVDRIDDSKEARAMHGLYAKLLSNMTIGVSEGFKKGLVITGVGYRAELKGRSIFFNLGYSTQIEYVLPEGIEAKLETPTKLEVSGIDKVKVGQAAAEIRSLRKPEPYKGKGIRYEDEVIRRKVGKSNVKK